MRIDVLSVPPSLTSVAAGQNQVRQTAAAPAASAAEESQAAASVQPVRNNVLVENITPSEDEEPFLSPEDIEKLVNRGNKLFEDLRLNEQFRLVRHDKLPRTMIRLMDVQSDRIIREFPPKKYLDLVAALQELSGLMLDERV